MWDAPVLSGSLPPDFPGPNGADRRKDWRFEVELHGELRYHAAAFAVQIADISGSGALIFMEDRPAAKPNSGSPTSAFCPSKSCMPANISAGSRSPIRHGIAIDCSIGYGRRRYRVAQWRPCR